MSLPSLRIAWSLTTSMPTPELSTRARCPHTMANVNRASPNLIAGTVLAESRAPRSRAMGCDSPVIRPTHSGDVLESGAILRNYFAVQREPRVD